MVRTPSARQNAKDKLQCRSGICVLGLARAWEWILSGLMPPGENPVKWTWVACICSCVRESEKEGAVYYLCLSFGLYRCHPIYRCHPLGVPHHDLLIFHYSRSDARKDTTFYIFLINSVGTPIRKNGTPIQKIHFLRDFF